MADAPDVGRGAPRLEQLRWYTPQRSRANETDRFRITRTAPLLLYVGTSYANLRGG